MAVGRAAGGAQHQARIQVGVGGSGRGRGQSHRKHICQRVHCARRATSSPPSSGGRRGVLLKWAGTWREAAALCCPPARKACGIHLEATAYGSNGQGWRGGRCWAVPVSCVPTRALCCCGASQPRRDCPGCVAGMQSGSTMPMLRACMASCPQAALHCRAASLSAQTTHGIAKPCRPLLFQHRRSSHLSTPVPRCRTISPVQAGPGSGAGARGGGHVPAAGQGAVDVEPRVGARGGGGGGGGGGGCKCGCGCGCGLIIAPLASLSESPDNLSCTCEQAHLVLGVLRYMRWCGCGCRSGCGFTGQG